MTRVDFYILPQAEDDARLRFVCRLAEKAFDAGLNVFIRTSARAESQRLDDLLWTFSDRTFIPHEIHSGAPTVHSQIKLLIGEAVAPPSHRQLLINLAPQLPDEPESYERIAEVIDADSERKRLARERFKHYRDRGHTLETHNL